MGMDCFVHHAYGVLLENYDDDLAAQIAASFHLNDQRDRHDAGEDDGEFADEVLSVTPAGLAFQEWLVKDLAPRSAEGTPHDTVLAFFRDRVVAALRPHFNIGSCDNWDLFWTGGGDDRCARCSAPVDAVIVGYGMMMHDPWKMFAEHPPASFKAACRHYHWAEIG